ncbi:glucuronyl esterase domain-containing protein [Aquisphaera insulae]|uniref:glucuronyl esterase domain-containing protein n=1 Tax=Aquisphaera insulae TaxID=2712864 RepID=UPI0013EC0EFE|nr:acetylxylan esterase [Aquisphaera insulae]
MTTQGRKREINYEESRVGTYTLPDPLVCADGTPVKTADDWMARRRPELVKLFESQMFGRVPEAARSVKPRCVVTSEAKDALSGKAIRRLVDIHVSDDPAAPVIHLLVYLPANLDPGKRVPLFLCLNFWANHAISDDPGIPLSTRWIRSEGPPGIVNDRATEKARGSDHMIPVERILARGYAVATTYYGDIEEDHVGGLRNGVRGTFLRPGQAEPAADEWGAIAAWAWGLSRAMDYLETSPDVDANRVALMGHSRLGKTALWAGVNDPRFAIVISNNSGEGGAALSKRDYGETIEHLNSSFPHWFCGNYKAFTNREDALPFDQHEEIALIAPRPVLIVSAEEDRWADPKGEFLAAKAAEPVYKLMGTDGLGLDLWPKPAVDSLSTGTIGYRIRPGKHDVTVDDWIAYMDFADHHWKIRR